MTPFKEYLSTRNISYVYFFVLFFISVFFAVGAHAEEIYTSIPNGNVEEADPSDPDSPNHWMRGGYGVNTPVFTYPILSHDGSKAVQVSITAYTDGDAKWYAEPVVISPNTGYRFMSSYTADVPTGTIIHFLDDEGEFLSQVDLGYAPETSSGTWATWDKSFHTPENATQMVVFRLLDRVGTLAVDDYTLVKDVEEPPVPSDGLFANGTLEEADPSDPDSPNHWERNSWGNHDATFMYPVDNGNGGRAARVSIINYASGDAKWYHKEVSVIGGSDYTYDGRYRSSVPTSIFVSYGYDDGTYRNEYSVTLPASDMWTSTTVSVSIPPSVVTMTVFHVLESDGFLELDDATLTHTPLTEEKTFEPSIVTITFDDGRLDNYMNARPILDAANIKGSFYIITEKMNDSQEWDYYMNPVQVKELYDYGHEIGSHTVTHPDLTEISFFDLAYEIVGSKQDLSNMGIIADTFVYPYGKGEADEYVRQVVADAGYVGARGVESGYNLRNSDTLALRVQYITRDTTTEDFQSWVDTSKRDKTWLVLLFHGVNENEDDFYGIDTVLFEEMVDYLVVRNVETVTLREGFARMNP
jgi:peptidoglycan/xylan/chitin deacetylase (PgdA/CDA1 family)